MSESKRPAVRRRKRTCLITGGYFFHFRYPPSTKQQPLLFFYRATLPNKKLLVEEEGGDQCNFVFTTYHPCRPHRAAAGERACVFPVATTARQSFWQWRCTERDLLSRRLEDFRTRTRSSSNLTNPNKKKKEKKRARTHLHGGELLNFGIMPAIDGQRLVTFEDDERESEYGYVRKVGMQYVFCACAFCKLHFSLWFPIQDGKLVINLEQLRVMGVGEMLAFFAIVL